MNAATSLPSFDWRTVAPEDWPYLVDLLPGNDRPSGLRIRTTAERDLPPEHLAAVDKAVRGEGGRLTPESRWDIRQDLSIRLLNYRGEPIRNVEAWCIKVARDLVFDAQRDEAKRRRAEHVFATGAKPGYRLGPIWRPTWYSPRRHDAPPRPVAEEHAPLACRGARVMHLKRPPSDLAASDSWDSWGGGDVETALVEMIDERRAREREKARAAREREKARAAHELCRRRSNSTGSSLRIKK